MEVHLLRTNVTCNPNPPLVASASVPTIQTLHSIPLHLPAPTATARKAAARLERLGSPTAVQNAAMK